MSNIKFDNLDKLHTVLNAKKCPQPKENQENTPKVKEGITVHLSCLGDMMATSTSESENARVLEMKRRIETDNYRVNTDVLAKKLFPHLLKSMG